MGDFDYDFLFQVILLFLQVKDPFIGTYIQDGVESGNRGQISLQSGLILIRPDWQADVNPCKGVLVREPQAMIIILTNGIDLIVR